MALEHHRTSQPRPRPSSSTAFSPFTQSRDDRFILRAHQYALRHCLGLTYDFNLVHTTLGLRAYVLSLPPPPCNRAASAVMDWKSLIKGRFLVILPVFFAYLLGSFASLRVRSHCIQTKIFLLTLQQFSIAARTASRSVAVKTAENPADENRKQCLMFFMEVCLLLSVLGYFVFEVSFFGWIFRGFVTIFLTAPLSMVCCHVIICLLRAHDGTVHCALYRRAAICLP